MFYPLLASLTLITISAYRSLSLSQAQRELVERFTGKEIALEGTVVSSGDLYVLVAADRLANIGVGVHVGNEEITQLASTGYKNTVKIYLKNSGLRPGDSVAGSIFCYMNQPQNGLLCGRASSETLTPLERPPPDIVSGMWRSWLRMRAHIFSVFEKALSTNALALVRSLFFGVSYGVGSAREDAGKWGIIHLLARSGLHLVLLLWIFRKSFALIPTRPNVRARYRMARSWILYRSKLCFVLLSSCSEYGVCWRCNPILRSPPLSAISMGLWV